MDTYCTFKWSDGRTDGRDDRGTADHSTPIISRTLLVDYCHDSRYLSSFADGNKKHPGLADDPWSFAVSDTDAAGKWIFDASKNRWLRSSVEWLELWREWWWRTLHVMEWRGKRNPLMQSHK
jgi:hypothetical protein